MLPTESLEAATMLMPNCEYSVRQDTLNGPRVRYVRVGDKLVHRWECDNRAFNPNKIYLIYKHICSKLWNAGKELFRQRW
jgi:hypothetical protein